MVLLEAFQELDGWRTAPRLADLAQRSWEVLQRRRPLLGDLSDNFPASGEGGASLQWQRYWRGNPINAWIGGNVADTAPHFFRLEEDRFVPPSAVPAEAVETLASLVQEIAD